MEPQVVAHTICFDLLMQHEQRNSVSTRTCNVVAFAKYVRPGRQQDCDAYDLQKCSGHHRAAYLLSFFGHTRSANCTSSPHIWRVIPKKLHIVVIYEAGCMNFLWNKNKSQKRTELIFTSLLKNFLKLLRLLRRWFCTLHLIGTAHVWVGRAKTW